MKRIKVIITGEVQGKNFRAAIQEKALMLDLNGYVKNNDDGSVTSIFEGDEADVDEMIEFCKEYQGEFQLTMLKSLTRIIRASLMILR